MGKNAEKPNRRKKGAGRSLNLLLWFAFSMFAFVLVVIFMAVQGLLVGQQYRSQTVELMRSASGEMTEYLGNSETISTESWRQMRRLEEKYDVRFRLLDTSGRNMFADTVEGESYPEIAEELKDRITGSASDVVITEGDSIAYASLLTLSGRTYFLYVSSSVARLNTLETGLRLLTIVTALFSVVLAFVVSGFVAMLITKPVTEVTEQAKELAHGNWDKVKKKEYFCREIEELSETLDYAGREISQTDRMQKELIANVSHDFRTPLTMIKAYASMIREISGDNKQKRDKHAQIIIDETDRLTALVDDMLDLSRIRAGVGKHEGERFSFSESIYRIVSRFDYLTETQGYTIASRVEPDLWIESDRERIEQVAYNLISNAVNYTGDDKKVSVRLLRTGDAARFEVEDTGKGIPPDEINTIWDRYYRSHETHKRPVQGTGLGLSIVKSILDAQDCPFGVYSNEGAGSTFWFEFPLSQEQTKKEEARPKRRGER